MLMKVRSPQGAAAELLSEPKTARGWSLKKRLAAMEALVAEIERRQHTDREGAVKIICDRFGRSRWTVFSWLSVREVEVRKGKEAKGGPPEEILDNLRYELGFLEPVPLLKDR